MVRIPMAGACCSLVVSAFMGVTPGSAFGAQPAASDARQLEEIVVTARKREETLQETPVAVTSFRSDFAERFRVERIEDISNFTPGLLVSDSGGQTGGGIFLRGIGSSSTSALIDQAIAINVDGVPVNSGHFVRTTMLDIEQIDVLRGPQALFFGKNSPGGVIAFRSADPTDAFESEVSAGNEFKADEWFLRGMISSPLSETVGARLAISYSEADGHRRLRGTDIPDIAFAPKPDKYADSETLFLRGTLLFRNHDGLQVRLKATHYQDERNRGGSGLQQRVACPLGAPQAIVQMDDCRMDNVAFVGNFHPDVLASDALFNQSKPGGWQDHDQQILSLDVEYDLTPSLSLTSISAYIDMDESEQGEFGAEPAAKIMRATVYGNEKFSQELRLTTSFSAPLNFMLGAYYETGDAETETIAVLAPALAGGQPFPVGKQRMTQDQDAYSVFGQVLWDITPSVELSAGTRYSYEEKSISATSFGNPVDLAADEDDWDNVSSEATLSWRPTPDLMLYASYREGFKSGGLDGSFNPAFAGPGPHEVRYDEESIDGWEGGVKAMLLNRTLLLNTAVFTYDYSDLQLGNFDPEATTLRILNVGKASVDGLEFEMQWLPSRVAGLTLSGSLSLLDTNLDEFIGDCYTGQRPDQGCNLTPVGGAFTQQDLSGRSLPVAADVSGRLGFHYERPLTGSLNVAVSADALYSDSFHGDTTQSPFTIQDSYWKINAAVSVFTSDDRWTVSATGRNLTDEYTFINSGSVPVTGSGTGTPTGVPADILAVVQPGRTVSLQVTYRP